MTNHNWWDNFRPNNLKSLGAFVSVVTEKCQMYCLISSLCKICGNDVVGINSRCSRQMCEYHIQTSLNFKDFAKKNSFLPLIWCSHSLLLLCTGISLENNPTKQTSNTCTCITLYHHLLSLARLHTCQVRVTVGDSSLLLYLCYVFQALINSFVYWFCMSTLGLILIQICHMKECQSVCNYQCYC